jgi:hypothetical protein
MTVGLSPLMAMIGGVVYAILVTVLRSPVLVVSSGRLRFRQLGEMPPCFRHLEKLRLVAIVCGCLSHPKRINGITSVALERLHPKDPSTHFCHTAAQQA